MDVTGPFILLFLLVEPIFSTSNKFPDGFSFGVASAAYQIEGGYESRGETIFDYEQSLNASIVLNSDNAKVACDSYHKYEEDLALLQNLGVDFYRFSIAWTRILPTGYSNKISPDGVRYYNNLINGLLSRNIQPMVTIFHYDLPKLLSDIGGWTNPHLADLFEDYSRILFQNFGDRVKKWITFNSNLWGCGDAEWPPMLNQSGIGEYLCVKTTLLAHSKAYRLYEKEFKGEQNGEVGFVADGRWYEPFSNSPKDEEAAERAREFGIGLFLNPIYGSGDYPEVVKERVAKLSREEGFLRSRLPFFSPEEKEYVRGTFDFLGLNMYTTYLTQDDSHGEKSYSFDKDMGVKLYQDPSWAKSTADWLRVVPWGLRKSLKWLKDKYSNPPIVITENGFADGGEIEDLGRINYYKSYLKSLLESIHEDGVQVKGFAAWSLLDNFEWLDGYSQHFGLHHVDFNDPARKRTPKASAKWYKKLLERRQLDDALADPDAIKTEL